MEIELVPILAGALVALAGLGLVADGWLPDSAPRTAERRRRARATRDCPGEILIGLGLIACAAALIGRDTWRWGTVAVLGGVALMLVGGLRNRRYLAERLTHRGKLRRGRQGDRREELAPLAPGDRRGEDRRAVEAEVPLVAGSADRLRPEAGGPDRTATGRPTGGDLAGPQGAVDRRGAPGG